MAKKPVLTEEDPVSLINMDPATAARSIDAAVSQKTDEYDFLTEKATIQFYNIEQPGRSQSFCFGTCNNPERITLDHGEIRELSRAAIRFIESRQTPIYEYQKEGGDATTNKRATIKKKIVGWKPRFQCREVRVPKQKVI
jgi:hypothetical protein